MTPTETVYFVHLSDTHFGSTADYTRHGHAPLPSARKLVAMINTLPQRPDFVIHTGDVVTEPETAAYQLAADVFGELDVPIYYVVGNHDTAQQIRQYLPMGPTVWQSPNPDLLSYAFAVKGYRFLVLDARGPDEIDPHGIFSDEQIGVIQREATPDGPPLTIFMHYPIHPLNSIWMDAYMLVINGKELHKALVPVKERVRGVFHGHIHQNMQTMRDGVLYVAVSSVFSQFSAWPDEARTGFDPLHPPGYNFVHMMPQQTIVHQHVFPRPEGD